MSQPPSWSAENYSETTSNGIRTESARFLIRFPGFKSYLQSLTSHSGYQNCVTGMSANSRAKLVWTAHVRMSGFDINSHVGVGFGLDRHHNVIHGTEVNVQCEYSIKSNGRVTWKKTRVSSVFTAGDFICVCCDPFIEKQELLSWSQDLLCDGTLTVTCDLTAEFSTGRDHSTTSAPADGRTSADFSLLLEKPLPFSDVTLVAGGIRFPAHKCILAARSPVFCAMFEHDTQESRDGRVEIPDVEPQVLMDLLDFIYSGKVGDMSDKLFAAADKYQLQELMATGAEHLAKTLHAGNAVDMLILAHQHSAEELKARALRVVLPRVEQLVDSHDIERLYAYPQLVNEVIKATAKRVRNTV